LFAPLGLLIPPAALLVWAIVNITDRVAWRAAAVSVAASALAVPLLFPWLGEADLSRLLTDGTAYWTIPAVTAIVAGVGALATLLAAPQRLALLAGWGAIIVVAGAVVARSGDLDLGREVEGIGLAMVTLGLALIVGPSFESITRIREVGGWRRLVAGVAVAASVFLVAAAALTMVGGRAGFPSDEYRNAFTFTAARPGDPSASRILVVGAPGGLPGDDRIVEGGAYRLVSAPMPESWEAHLHEPRIGDEALAETLSLIIGGETKRAGELLAAFGIRWIVVLDDGDGDRFANAWRTVFVGQLDLVPLGGGLDNTTFENEAESAARAVTSTGNLWARSGTGYEGRTEFSSDLEIRENANGRWGPGEWQQSDWANSVPTSAGVAEFDPIGSRRSQAIFAAVWLVVLVGFSWAGRRFG
jgi:hypothetical protein